MAKKRAGKQPGNAKEGGSSGLSKERKDHLQKMLIENFTSLQDVMTDLAGKFGNLTNQMSRLLELFEQSAKTFMEKDLKFAGGSDKDLVSKLDRLLEQNKVIAQGITMLHEEHSTMPDSNPEQSPLPTFTQQTANQENANRYQRSISSKQDGKIQARQNPGQ
ncbi:MAG: hypothetical protein PHH00_02625 [Candidatus Nanoarchaeia archaeon]|nr:hypothetical protein [Candidatus Nanoarchaeia archaeon]